MTTTKSDASDVSKSLKERVREARVWLTEFHGSGGSAEPFFIPVALQCREEGQWHELRGICDGRGPIPARSMSRTQLLVALAEALVEASSTADVFACAYPHPEWGRRKGGSFQRVHVHADIDGPVDLGKVDFLGAMAVASGSSVDGNPHAHVYVRLSRPVTLWEHSSLVRAVGQFVGAEFHDQSKVSDADYLRVPGTINHKGPVGKPVTWLVPPDSPRVRTMQPELLARLLRVEWPPRPSTTPTSAGPRHQFEAIEQQRISVRMDGLTAFVRDANRGEGNNALNWAAGKAGALCALGDVSPRRAACLRAALLEAYLSRPVPQGESLMSRRREAIATLNSGWRWGEQNRAEMPPRSSVRRGS